MTRIWKETACFMSQDFSFAKFFKWHSCQLCRTLWVDHTTVSGNGLYTVCPLYTDNEIKHGDGLVTVSDAFF